MNTNKAMTDYTKFEIDADLPEKVKFNVRNTIDLLSACNLPFSLIFIIASRIQTAFYSGSIAGHDSAAKIFRAEVEKIGGAL